MRAFNIEIVTPDGLEYSGEAESLLVRTTEGDVEILAGHTDFLASLSTGTARLIIDGKKRMASTSGGFLSVKGGKVRMCATTFEFAEDIDLKRAEDAKARAEAALSMAKDQREMRIARAKLMRAASRIKAAKN
jgi:F-type H+-transporting ATPase subunit epsilon